MGIPCLLFSCILAYKAPLLFFIKPPEEPQCIISWWASVELSSLVYRCKRRRYQGVYGDTLSSLQLYTGTQISPSLLHQASRRTTVHIILMSLLWTFVSCLLMQEKKIQRSLWGYLVFSRAVYWHSNLPFSSSSSLQKFYSAHYLHELAFYLFHLLTDAREEGTKEFIGIPCLLFSCKVSFKSSFLFFIKPSEVLQCTLSSWACFLSFSLTYRCKRRRYKGVYRDTLSSLQL